MPTALQPTPTQAVVQIRQYWRGEGLALHWDLTIWTSGSGAKGDEQKGYTYQVRGGMDTFEFEKFVSKYSQKISFKHLFALSTYHCLYVIWAE